MIFNWLPYILTKIFIDTHRTELGIVVVRFPDVDHLILRAGYDVLAVVRERCLDLGRYIQVALVFAAQVQIPQVVQADTAVVRCYQDFVLTCNGKSGPTKALMSS